MSATLRALQAKKADAIKGMRSLSDKAATEGRDFTAEEQAQYDQHKASAETLTASINREQELIQAEAGLGAMAGGGGGAQAPPVAAAPGAGGVVVPAGARIDVEHNADKDDNRGFRSMGDFARSVRHASHVGRMGGQIDARLNALGGMAALHAGMQAAAPTNPGVESNGADGGFLIPPGFSNTIWAHSLEEQALLPLTDRLPIEGNSMSLPKDETTPWGSNGVRAYWQNEATAGTGSKPVLGRTELKLKKLMALVPMSDELMADAVALGAYLEPNMARSIRWKTDEAILFGTGAGQPLGALRSGGPMVSVAKETSQTAATVNIQNISKMVARLLAGSYGTSVWLVNNDVLPQLFTLVLGNVPVYLPASEGAKSNPYGTLMGRPVIVTQHAKSVGAQGDISLLDLRGYQSIESQGGIQTATSMHLYFDADSIAFRSTFRVDGQPKAAAAVSPANGSNSLSYFVQLDVRA
jgi:HK97 family phage major capsid protein